MMKKLTSLLLGLVACTVMSTTQANLTTNGGFETGDFTGWTQSGNTGLTGVNTGSAHSGTYGAYSGPVGSLGYLSQTFATTPGQTYGLSFWLSNSGDSPTNSFAVSVDNFTNTLVSLTDSAFFPYNPFTSSFTADNTGTTTLSFAFRNDPSFWLLDDIDVSSAVPEPAMLALLGLGLAGLGFTRRRRT